MNSWKDNLMRFPGVRKLSIARTHLLSQWFDWRHRVDTCGTADPQELSVVGDNSSHANLYWATTPAFGRLMLSDPPVTDVSSYTFVDMGSGKGRMLFFAAELPFRRIIGVEFASDLDAIARKNVKTYRNPRQLCFDIEPVHMDAAQYQFPPEPSFIYFFNPFDRFVMEPVIRNLDRSIEEHPRDVIVLCCNPILSDVVEAARNLKVYAKRSYFGSLYNIYRTAVSSNGHGPDAPA
jgi:SAM-dependent methyltransferase